ncbi:MAG TPA: carboxypeptidase regulatory-like domain-containing protein [Verrucomicrobiae bacterium]|nr:carboxypeptidase regulatory-like domain-containing protein [Verrucomicrobiae bacterium]
MRHSIARTLGVVCMLFLFLLPVAFLAQNAKTSTSAAGKTTREKILTVDEGPAIKVPGRLRRDRRTPSAQQAGAENSDARPVETPGFRVVSHPREDRLKRGRAFHGDVRTLPQIPPEKFERPEFEGPRVTPVPYPGSAANAPASTQEAPVTASAPAPSASNSFEGLDFTNWGAGHPPDTNGDVGPTYYIQTINTSVGIYNKSDGTRVAAFAFNTLMSQGALGNLCDTANFGDPVVVYDTFEDRWIITDFAFTLSGGNAVAPEYQCFAVSKSGDPVAGGWNFYSIQVNGGFGDYPKFGIWPDGLYMSANIFGFGAGGTFQNVRVWALNKAQMYAGNPTVQVLSFDAPAAEFTLLPSNARLQTGTPPAGSPNYFSVVAQFLNTVSVYKLHADWKNISTSTFSGPFLSLTATSWSQLLAANQTEQSPGNKLDTLYFRLMMQNQYTNIGGVESLWNSHTVGATGATSAQAAVRYYQVKVTGGTVEANASQSFTYSPDATVFRFMPSVAVDRAGDMAIGYSATNATLNPAIRYAGRLAGDAPNTISQTEQSLIEGTGTQSGNCGASCTRWGDYSAMTLDQDGCTFWYTNMYYQTTGLAFNTRIGAFSFPGCTPAVSGALQGTVTDSGTSSPISGVTVALGSRTTTTDVNGAYSFASLPSGTYPTITASFPGYTSLTVANIVINDGLTTTQNFSLTLAATSGCITDTSQADFSAGVPTSCDLTTSPGDVILTNSPTIDQQNTTVGNSGVGITITTWGGQTFTPSVTGRLTRADINLFCSGCSGTTPNLTLSVRATSAGLPTGADLASTTFTGFSSGAAVFYTANFSSPPTLTAGTQYAIVIRPTANPSPGTYALTRSGSGTLGSNVYPGGTRVSGATSGTVWSIPTTGGVTTDAGFKIFMQTGFPPSGTFVSSMKDANPAPNVTATWSTLSWNATTPAGTSVQFQAAASNSISGPFNFVGPDGTGSTFFSNGGSLAQFNGNRYLKYQASLSTSSSASTPTLQDVTICFVDTPLTTLVVAAASGPFGGTADLSATLSSNGTGLSGKSVAFTLNGNSAGSGTTDNNGLATVSAASLTGINAGSYPSGVAAAFAGDSGFTASSGTAALTVTKIDQTITFGALSNATFGDADFSVSATASSGLTVTFAASGNCSVTGSTVHITGAGSCTITASQPGDSNYNAATDVPQSFSIAKANQTITFGALGNATFGDADFSVSASASSGLTVTFAASGNCSVTGSTVHITGAGSCTITASQPGDSNYNPATDVPQSFSIAKANQTITFGALGNATFGDADFSVSATATSGLTVAFAASGNCSVTGTTVHITGAGSCTITASQTGNSNYNPATGVPQSFSIAKASQTITFGALAGKNVGDPDFTVSASASSPLAVTFSASGNCSVTGSTVHITGAGSCTITASQAGNANYNAAADVPQSFPIAKTSQTITFGALANKTFGNADFSVGATATSTLAVTFSASGNCTVTGSTVHITGAGSCTITASQPGDSNFSAAADVPQSFTIAKAATSVTVSCPAGVVYDGNAHACTAAATGIAGVTVTGTHTLTYNGSATAPTGQGVYAVSDSFTSSDPNYANATATGSLTISAVTPGVASLLPVLTQQNSAAFLLTLNGTNFVPGSAVNWNGSARVTTFVGQTQVKAAILATDLTAVGTASLTVFNPAPGGGTSPAMTLAIDTPAGTAGAVTASSNTTTLTVTHGQSTTLTVTFTGETAGATVTAICYNLPAATTCALSGNTVTIATSAGTPVGSYQVIVVFTVTQTTTASLQSGQHSGFLASGIALLGLPLGLLWTRRGSKKPLRTAVLAFLGLALLLVLAGCGGRSQITATGHQVTSQTSVSVTLNVI